MPSHFSLDLSKLIMFYIIIGLLDFRHQAAFIHVKQDSVQSESTIREVKINEQFKKQVDFINLPYNDDDDECKHMSFYFVTHKKLLRRIQSIKENLYNMYACGLYCGDGHHHDSDDLLSGRVHSVAPEAYHKITNDSSLPFVCFLFALCIYYQLN